MTDLCFDRSRVSTGTEFLIENCDCRLTDEDLNEEGNAFTAYYYEHFYYEDLENIYGDVSHEESAYDFDTLNKKLTARYQEWLANKRPKKVPSDSSESLRQDRETDKPSLWDRAKNWFSK